MKRGDVVAARFELVAPIAKGGISVLWSARDRRDDDVVAVKIVENAPREAIERFGREVKVLAKLDHPHIVRYRAHGSIGIGSVFLAMDHLRGETLARRLKRGPLEVEDTLVMAQRLAEALGEAHRNGVVHRDLKPSNIFLRTSAVEHPMLLDFGVARLVLDASLTPTGQALGTPAYMAPEQAKGGAEHGPAADVYGLGAVMFKCLTGRPLFQGMNVMGVLAKVLLEAPPALREVRPDVPEALDRLVRRMLAKRPEERFADGGAAADALGKLIEGQAQHLSSRPPPKPSLFPELDDGHALSVVLVADPESAGTRRPAHELRTWKARATEVAEHHGGFAELLSEGTPVIVLPGDTDVTALCRRAIDVALELRRHLPTVALGVATVTGSPDGTHALVGATIDVAGATLTQVTPRPGDICLDATTADTAEDIGHNLLAAGDGYLLNTPR